MPSLITPRNPRPSGWLLARVTVASIIAILFGYRWQEGWLTWPLISMSAIVLALLLLEVFTADRRRKEQDVYADGRPVPRRRSTDRKSAEVVIGSQTPNVS